jgi:hypothetical protein
MRFICIVTLLCCSTVFAQRSQPPQGVPNPPRDTAAAVARYVEYDTAKNTLWMEAVLGHLRTRQLYCLTARSPLFYPTHRRTQKEIGTERVSDAVIAHRRCTST